MEGRATVAPTASRWAATIRANGVSEDMSASDRERGEGFQWVVSPIVAVPSR